MKRFNLSHAQCNGNKKKFVNEKVNENFPRFPSFQFQVYDKIENSETSEMGIFSSQTTS